MFVWLYGWRTDSHMFIPLYIRVIRSKSALIRVIGPGLRGGIYWGIEIKTQNTAGTGRFFIILQAIDENRLTPVKFQ